MTEIFGDRTREMLEIFAAYKGDHKHAIGAKEGAAEWLNELDQSSSGTGIPTKPK